MPLTVAVALTATLARRIYVAVLNSMRRRLDAGGGDDFNPPRVRRRQLGTYHHEVESSGATRRAATCRIGFLFWARCVGFLFSVEAPACGPRRFYNVHPFFVRKGAGLLRSASRCCLHRVDRTTLPGRGEDALFTNAH